MVLNLTILSRTKKRKNAFKMRRMRRLRSFYACVKYHSGICSPFIHSECSIQWLCWRTVKALIRLRGCAGWSGPSLSAYTRRHVFAWRGPSNPAESMVLNVHNLANFGRRCYSWTNYMICGITNDKISGAVLQVHFRWKAYHILQERTQRERKENNNISSAVLQVHFKWKA